MESESGYPRKRARTRRRLVRAGMEVLAARGPSGATVGDIADAAEVASGTFYNHFSSLDELVEAVTDELGVGVEISRGALDAIEHDPAARVAIGTLQLLEMANTDPNAAAAFFALVATVPKFRERIRGIVARAISDGVDSGRFDVDAGHAATNAVLGTTLQSMRSLVLGESDQSDAPTVAELVLRTLGVESNEARQIALEALDRVAAGEQLTSA